MPSSRGDTEHQHARSHIYPPQPPSHCASSLEAENPPSSSILRRFARVFNFWGKRNTVMTSGASQTGSTGFPEVVSTPSPESNPSVPLSQTPSASDSARTESSSTKSRSKKAATKPAPPIAVPSWRYKAKVQKFTVREENEFSVTCTIVQPVLRFRWPGFLKPNRFRCFRRRTKKDGGTKVEEKSVRRRRRFSRRVAVEQDVCDDLQDWHLVESNHQAPEPAPASQRTRKPRPQSHSQRTQDKERRLVATRRNSGWAGVFSSAANYPDSAGTSTNLSSRTGTSSGASLSRSRSRSRSQDEEGEEETAGFTIDRNSKTLVVPDVDIGIARIVKEEIEKYASPEEASIRLVRPRARNPDETLEYDAFGRDSLQSWLDLE